MRGPRCCFIPWCDVIALPFDVHRKYEGYLTSIAPTDPDEDEEEYSVSKGPKSITATADVLKDFQGNGDVC